MSRDIFAEWSAICKVEWIKAKESEAREFEDMIKAWTRP